MKHKLFTLLLAVATIAGTMFASNTQVDGIWYNFDDEHLTAEVTYQGANYISSSKKYSGEVVIPSSVTYNAQTYIVTSIGEYAFLNCTGLTSVEIPNSVTGIGESAFAACTGLTSIEIPNSVTSIGNLAFRNCFGLTSLSVEAGNTVYDSRNNCNAIIKTSTNTLIWGCQNTTIPNSVTSIGTYAFYYCSGLTSVEIPNGVISIGDFAFIGCSGLTSVTIGNSVTSIGNGAFRNCTGLTSVTNYATTPQTIHSSVFNGVNKSTCVLNVPKESVSLYQAAEVWKEFTNIVGVDIPGEDPDVPSSAPAVYTNPTNPAQKLIRNGNMYILTDDQTYTITGQKVK